LIVLVNLSASGRSVKAELYGYNQKVNAKSANAFVKPRTLRLCKNREQFAILTKQKTLTCCKSAFYFMKKGEQRSPFCGERGSLTYGFLEYHKIHKWLYVSRL